jgi:protein-S-isoprenylcysteine O-methyltransferase Ste14
MMNENIFRFLAAIILVSGIGISVYFRRRADQETGETVSRSVDGTAMTAIIRIAGLALWLSPFVYLFNPRWMAWSKLGLPVWTRWLGVALGVLCVFLIYWLFSSIGNNITPTSATRSEHQLVTNGPYRWVRHPLYTIGSSFIVSFGLIADNWFIIILGIFAFIIMAIRTPKEEANLIDKFGDQYRQYMQNTGRFLPHIFSK